jgi:hypothetical protein|tara:strand:+ start:332 stop:607 length:276 start_codon:yes stop_codon:yes gene_type:complete
MTYVNQEQKTARAENWILDLVGNASKRELTDSTPEHIKDLRVLGGAKKLKGKLLGVLWATGFKLTIDSNKIITALCELGIVDTEIQAGVFL